LDEAKYSIHLAVQHDENDENNVTAPHFLAIDRSRGIGVGIRKKA